MANNVEFHDFSVEVKAAMNDKIISTLYEVAGELVTRTQRNSRVDTGKTKGSFQYKVVEDELTAYIGSDYENAIWEEFGTGEYALNGDGRKGGWFYEDAEGNGHFTHGKKPSRAFWKAYTGFKNAIINRFQQVMKGL